MQKKFGKLSWEVILYLPLLHHFDSLTVWSFTHAYRNHRSIQHVPLDTIFYSDWVSLEYNPVEFQASTEPTLGSTWHSLTGFSSDLNWDSSLAFMASMACVGPRAHSWAKALLQQGFFAKTPLECHENHYWYLLITKRCSKDSVLFPYTYTYLFQAGIWHGQCTPNAMQRQLRLSFQQWREPNETKSGNPRVGQITWNQHGG